MLISLVVLPLAAENSALQGTLSHNREGRGVAIYPFDSAEQAAASLTEQLDTLSSYYRALSIERMEGGSKSSFGYLNSLVGRQLKLVVGSSPQPYEVLVNGEVVGYSSTGATPSIFNITKAAQQGERNEVVFKYLPFEGVERIEGWSSRGDMVEDAYIISQPTLHIVDIFEKTTIAASGVASSMIGVRLQSTALGEQQARIFYDVTSPQGELLTQGSRDVAIQMRGEQSVTFSAIVPDSMLWSAASPTLYSLNLRNQKSGRKMEHMSFSVGFRSVEWGESGKLYINGEEVEISAKRVDASISIEELERFKAEGFNTFIISAGRYNSQIYSWADSQGAYLIPTAAINSSKGGATIKRGDNPTNDPAWREIYTSRSDDIYCVTQAHPSVVAFAIGESSLNADNLYHSYLHLKAKGDSRAIIYLDSQGQWNSDKIEFKVIE